MAKNVETKTDFSAVNRWLEENVLTMLMEKCESPLEAIFLLTSFAKNAALTIGLTAGLPPSKTIEACQAIFSEKNYNDKAMTAMAEVMAKKIKENGGVCDLEDAIAAVDEVARKEGN